MPEAISDKDLGRQWRDWPSPPLATEPIEKIVAALPAASLESRGFKGCRDSIRIHLCSPYTLLYSAVLHRP